MPTYTYECRACEHRFEAFQGMNDQALKVCPECGKDIRRIIAGGSGIIFKGSGFYVNDSKKSDSSSASKPASSGHSCANCPKKETA